MKCQPFKTERLLSTLDVANTTMKIYNVNSMIKSSDLRENYRVPHASGVIKPSLEISLLIAFKGLIIN